MECSVIDDDDVLNIQIDANEEILENDDNSFLDQDFDNIGDFNDTNDANELLKDIVLDNTQNESINKLAKKETIDDTLVRIRKELEQVNIKINDDSDGDFKNKYGDEYKCLAKLYNNQLKMIYSQFSQLNEEEKNEDRRSDKNNCEEPNTQLKLPNIEINYINLQKVTRLEAKLSQLETIVGVNYNNGNGNNFVDNKDFLSVTNQINQLYRQIILLKQTTSNKDAYESENLSKKKLKDILPQEVNTSNDDIEKFKNISKNDDLVELCKYLPLLPHITMRVRKLSSINNIINDEIKQINDLNRTIKQLEIQQKQWLNILNKIEKHIDKQIEEQ